MTSSGGDKQAEAFIELAFDPIDFPKDGILLTGLLRMKLMYRLGNNDNHYFLE